MDFFRILLLIVPMYVANGSAVLFKGNTRLDFGKNFFDNRPVFGNGKTFRGTIFSIIAGTIAAFAIALLFPEIVKNYSSNYFLAGFLLSVGAIGGDLAASFLKRRLGLKQGEEFFPLDQLDFTIGGLILANFFLPPEIPEILLILLLTIFVHRFSNWIAFKLKLKNVPW